MPENTRAGDPRVALALILGTLIGLAFKAAGFLPNIPLWVVLLPAIFTAVKSIFFMLTVNAVREGMILATRDLDVAVRHDPVLNVLDGDRFSATVR